MYHPHLFARRAELLALRDIAVTLPISETISPILEPIKADERDLKRALEILGKSNVTVSVILNPVEGDFKGGANLASWRQALVDIFQEFPTILPAYVCRPSSSTQNISNFLADFPERATSLLYWSPKISDEHIVTLANNELVRFHINLLDQMSVARRALLPAAKAVDVRDHFAKSERNADYGGPEFFSDDQLTFRENASGFGDYSIVGAKFVAGGGQAHAVAIHAIYLGDGGSLWVEHFISDDVEIEVGTVEGKYLQAAAKLVAAVGERPNEFGKDSALDGFRMDVENHSFPGLAMSKRRQILHHLALVHATYFQA